MIFSILAVFVNTMLCSGVHSNFPGWQRTDYTVAQDYTAEQNICFFFDSIYYDFEAWDAKTTVFTMILKHGMQNKA